MATVEERFKAAVNVIKGLPKNGPYQPSNTMMLKFYGLYKQAVEGPCHQKKPAFWDVVGKAKWEAWNDNRHLTKQEAMSRYVESLREIIETMSFTENVQNFVGSLDGLDINLNDLDAVAPGMREVAESHPDSPFNSRAASPQRISRSNSLPDSNENGVEILPNGKANGHLSNGFNVEEKRLQKEDTEKETLERLASNVDQSDDEYGDPLDLQQDYVQQTKSLEHINAAVKLINADLQALNRRTTEMEQLLREMRLQLQLLSKFSSSKNIKLTRDIIPSWWPFTGISPAWFAVLILWPFIFKRMLLPKTRH